MRGIGVVVAAAMIASGAAGCGRSAGTYEPGSAQPAARAVTVSVENDYMLAMDIYAVSSGVTNRLGSVGPGMTRTLLLDPSFMPTGFVDIVAQPAGGGRIVSTGQLDPRAGQTVDFRIGIDLIGSQAWVH